MYSLDVVSVCECVCEFRTFVLGKFECLYKFVRNSTTENKNVIKGVLNKVYQYIFSNWKFAYSHTDTTYMRMHMYMY